MLLLVEVVTINITIIITINITIMMNLYVDVELWSERLFPMLSCSNAAFT